MTREEILELARECGASAYTNRHYQDETYMTFSPEKLEAFFHAAQRMKPPTPVSTVDFLPHDNYLRFAQRVLEGDAPTESDRKDAARMICDIRRALYIKAKQPPVEEPELPEPALYRCNDCRKTGLMIHCSDPINCGGMVSYYTASQMQAHFQAGVRAGMARGQSLQALQRGLDKVLADPEKHGLDLGDKQ